MRQAELVVIGVFVFGHLTGALVPETVPQAAVGSVLMAAVAVGLIKLAERTGVVESV